MEDHWRLHRRAAADRAAYTRTAPAVAASLDAMSASRTSRPGRKCSPLASASAASTAADGQQRPDVMCQRQASSAHAKQRNMLSPACFGKLKRVASVPRSQTLKTSAASSARQRQQRVAAAVGKWPQTSNVVSSAAAAKTHGLTCLILRQEAAEIPVLAVVANALHAEGHAPCTGISCGDIVDAARLDVPMAARTCADALRSTSRRAGVGAGADHHGDVDNVISVVGHRTSYSRGC